MLLLLPRLLLLPHCHMAATLLLRGAKTTSTKSGKQVVGHPRNSPMRGAMPKPSKV